MFYRRNSFAGSATGRSRRDRRVRAARDRRQRDRGLRRAAFAMAVYFNDLSTDERVALAQRDSGDVLDWRALDLDGPVIDKHSTGGVGDVVSLMLGPMVARAAAVPMISGVGPGHTPASRSTSSARFRATTWRRPTRVCRTWCAMSALRSSGRPRLAPADMRIYAIRDVTATVESVAMITASILSKKLAAGPDGAS